MDRDRFAALVDDVLAELPSWVVERLENLHVVVEDRPPPDREPAGTRLLGLYEGVPLPERAGGYVGALPDRITVFRLAHLELGSGQEELRRRVRRTVLHEIAHHLGIDDERLRELGWD